MPLPPNPRPTSDTEVGLEPVAEAPPRAAPEPATDPLATNAQTAVGLEPVLTTDQTAAALPPVVSAPRAKPERPAAPSALYLKWGPLGAGLAVLVLGVGLYLLDASNDASQSAEGAEDLVVSSTPSGATVLIDGHPLSSRTPVTARNLAAHRPHVLVVELPGHLRWTQHLKLNPGTANAVHAVLQPAQP